MSTISDNETVKSKSSKKDNKIDKLQTRLDAVEQRLSELDGIEQSPPKNYIKELQNHCAGRNLSIPLFPCLHRSTTTGNHYRVYGVIINDFKKIHSTGCGIDTFVAKNRAAKHALRELGWHISKPPKSSKKRDAPESEDSSDSTDDYKYWKSISWKNVEKKI